MDTHLLVERFGWTEDQLRRGLDWLISIGAERYMRAATLKMISDRMRRNSNQWCLPGETCFAGLDGDDDDCPMFEMY